MLFRGKDTQGKRRTDRGRRRFPWLASDARVLPTWGSTFCAPTSPCTLLLFLSSTLHHRLWSGCNHRQHRASVIVTELYLQYIYTCFLSVFVRICDCASGSYSLSPTSLTRCTEHRGFSRNILCLSYLSLASSPVSAPTRDTLTHFRPLGLPALPWVKTETRSSESSLLTFLFPPFETPVVLPDFYAFARITSTTCYETERERERAWDGVTKSWFKYQLS